ncbi:MAG: chitobiase/beta-hexosaminidase C-terminal domain-containing protein, partial [Bacteroidales bacterium]|nr:chitobiase/beta-hexosaminidase C-terminal domain-containing protein [Bacteroidales bacterium]
GQAYYFDRICGGMPFQSLDGIKEIANQLKDDPLFLGFQVHEWGNSPIHDYHRIRRLLLDKGLPLDHKHFSSFEGRIETPFFSAGDYSIHKDLYKPLKSLKDVEQYLQSYFKQIIEKTSGQVMSVTGFAQLQHTAFRLGAKNVMPEVGSQVPLTALQIAFTRGAAHEYGKPFGVYYEPWGGSPFGGACALDFSPWYPGVKKLETIMGKYRVGSEYGSSRSLQRRLLFYSWLAGATYWSEEWGAENYFSNWEDYPITEYGQITKDFLFISNQYSKPKPIVPIALVMPPETFGVDIRYIAGITEKLYGIAPPNLFHNKLRAFAADILAADQQIGLGKEDGSLTSSPWVSSFDVLSAEAPKEILDKYQFLVYFDEGQAANSSFPPERIQVYNGNKRDADYYLQVVENLLPFHINGVVGAAHARADGNYFLGIFNNLGIIKTTEGEIANPNAKQTVTIHGPCKEVQFLVGDEYLEELNNNSIKLNLPAGKIAILSFPEEAGNISKTFDFKSIVTTPYMNSDVRLFLNKMDVSLSCDTKDSKIFYTLDGSEPDKASMRYSKPFVINKTTTLKMCAFVEGRSSPIATVFIEKAEFEQSVKSGTVEPGIYFNYYTGEFQNVKDFANRESQKSGTLTNFSITPHDREQNFAFDFNGFIEVSTDGLYTFNLSSNDGSKLYLNNKLLIDNDGLHNAYLEKSKRIALEKGLHDISVKYFQSGGSYQLHLSWSGPEFEKIEIPSSVLFHAKEK